MGKNKDKRKRKRRKRTPAEHAERHSQNTPMIADAFAKVSSKAAGIFGKRCVSIGKSGLLLVDKQNKRGRRDKRGHHDGLSKYFWLVEYIRDVHGGGGSPRADGCRGSRFAVRAIE